MLNSQGMRNILTNHCNEGRSRLESISRGTVKPQLMNLCSPPDHASFSSWFYGFAQPVTLIPPNLIRFLHLALLSSCWILTGFLLVGCGKDSESVVTIAIHPTKPHIMYVGTNDAVFKTRDEGQTWKRFESFSARRVTTLAIDPKFPATIYAGTMGDAVYKSPDGGQRWLPHNVGLKEHVSFINQFIFDLHDSALIFAATTVGAFRTRDGARSWEEKMKGMKEVHIVITMAIHPTNANILYAGTTGGVYKSIDGTNSWKMVNKGLIPEDILMASMALGVNILEIDPHHPNTVYAGTTEGLFKTTNGGEAWERIGTSLPDQFISTLVIDQEQSSRLYIGGPAGIFQSEDGGDTWQEKNKGLTTLNIRILVKHPKNSSILYTGTNGSGLYRSTDQGASWTPLPLNETPSVPQTGSSTS